MEPEPPASPGPTVPGVGRRLLSLLYEALLAFATIFFALMDRFWAFLTDLVYRFN